MLEEREVKKILDLFKTELKVINIGGELFAESLRAQGVKMVHVDWRPPAGGDVQLTKMLKKLKGK